jgi:hypothetical protein
MGTTTVVRVIENPPDHLGAWLTFVGVFFGGIIVAIITAVTTQRRLRAQLASEERRHRDQPDFDRAETDRVELRAILESLAERLLAFTMRPTHGLRVLSDLSTRPPQDLPCCLSILRPDHDLVLSPDPPAVTSAGPAVGQPRHASDACAA